MTPTPPVTPEEAERIRAEGFRAGAEAMRERITGLLNLAAQHSMADAIRSLAIPEDRT